MKGTTIISRSAFVFLILSLGVITLAFAMPTKASAETVSVLTAQVIPPGQNTCAQLQVSGFTPYIYNNALHGFGFTITDASYVALAGSIGNTDIPFSRMTRTIDASGNLRINVSTETTPIYQSGLLIRVTLLSAKGSGQPVCLSLLSTTITPEPGAPMQPPPTPKPIPSPAPAPIPQPMPQPTPEKPSATTTIDTGTGTTSSTSTQVSATTSLASALKDICSSGGAPRLWFVLLAIYAIIVLTAVFGQGQMPSAMRSQEWIAAMIVVPFLLLFAIWYFAEACRVSAWVPVVATLMALAGLAAVFWDDRTKGNGGGSSVSVINLPAGQKK